MSDQDKQLSPCFPLIMPEQILFDFIKEMFSVVKQDYERNSHEPNKTFLYQIFNPIKIGQYDLYNNAVRLITAPDNDPRKIQVRLFFDESLSKFPAIHIVLPGENSEPGGLGFDRGYVDEIVDERENTYSDVLSRRFSSKYDLVIHSDNMIEVVLLYHLLRSMLISGFAALLNTGLEDLRFSGTEVSLYRDIVPQGHFMRVLSLSFSYESVVPEIDDVPIIQKINPVISTPIDNGTRRGH